MFFASSIFRHKTRFCSGSINSLKLFLCLLRSGLNSANKSSKRPRWHPEIRTKAVVIQLQLMAQTMKFLPAPAFSREPSISVSSISLTIRTSPSLLHVSFFHTVFLGQISTKTQHVWCVYTRYTTTTARLPNQCLIAHGHLKLWLKIQYSTTFHPCTFTSYIKNSIN